MVPAIRKGGSILGLHFCFISETTLISPSELYVLARAIEPTAIECANAWGLDAPAIDVIDDKKNLPFACQPVVFIDSETDSAALAVHYWDPVRLHPAARVYVDQASGLVSGTYSVSEGASHECFEALADPRCDLWTDLPGRSNVQVAIEICDPVQDTFDAGGGRIANYVHPAYFDSRLAAPDIALRFRQEGGRFDHLGTLSRAGLIGQEGYLILRNEHETWLEDDGGRFNVLRKPGAEHPWSRTQRRRNV
jgi:hypothetical protein